MNRTQWWCVGVVALVFVAGLGALAEDCTVTVQPGESIQAAIDAASPGDVICLAEGEWEENLIIEKSLTLRGQGAQQSAIQAKEEDRPVVRIDSPEGISVVIEGLTVTGAWGFLVAGILVEGSAQAAISESTVSENGQYGIRLRDSAQATIEGSTVSENGQYGIRLWDSAQAAISESTVSENERYGIWLEDSAQANIEGSTISGNRYGICLSGSAQATITSNVIRDNEGSGVALCERPCFDTDWVFTGYVTGSGNTVPGPEEEDGNRECAVCPDELAFLTTEEGGELDRRE